MPSQFGVQKLIGNGGRVEAAFALQPLATTDGEAEGSRSRAPRWLIPTKARRCAMQQRANDGMVAGNRWREWHLLAKRYQRHKWHWH